MDTNVSKDPTGPLPRSPIKEIRVIIAPKRIGSEPSPKIPFLFNFGLL